MSAPKCPSCGREMAYEPFVLRPSAYIRALNVCQSCRILNANKRKKEERECSRKR